MEKTHDCSNCIFNRGVIPGSDHHIKCGALGLALKKEGGMTPTMVLMSEITVAARHVPEYSDPELGLIIKVDPHGMRNGWADWPIQFDPVWIEVCKFHLSKEMYEKKEFPEGSVWSVGGTKDNTEGSSDSAPSTEASS